MNVAIGSAFRDSSSRGQLKRYFQQVAALDEALGSPVFVIASEGDSRDDTRKRLFANVAGRGVVVDSTHNMGFFGSTEHAARFQALQGVGNAILENVPDWVDVLVYVESDLLWDANEICWLIERLNEPGVDIVAPLVFAGECFYDVFAFRANGERFSPFEPFSHVFAEQGDLARVDSAGSCLVMKADVARQCRIDDKSGLVSFCNDARSKGFQVWADKSRKVRHP